MTLARSTWLRITGREAVYAPRNTNVTRSLFPASVFVTFVLTLSRLVPQAYAADFASLIYVNPAVRSIATILCQAYGKWKRLKTCQTQKLMMSLFQFLALVLRLAPPLRFLLHLLRSGDSA